MRQRVFMRMKVTRGFTLIELLIVVAIIGILASAVLVGLGPTRRAGRDARRISDLTQVQTGLELYFNKCGYYPGTASCQAKTAPTSWSDLTTALTDSSLGISNVPNDPTAGANYSYGVDTTNNNNAYVVGATLEDPSNPALTNSVKGTVFGVTCNSPVYCVRL